MSGIEKVSTATTRRAFAAALDLTGASDALRDRFWSKVDRRGPDECWPWLEHRKRSGYGQFVLRRGVFVTSSRVALALVEPLRDDCREHDPEWWFPDKGGNRSPAKRICRTCPVAAECLEYALVNRERFGIFGGATPTERAALLRRRGRG